MTEEGFRRFRCWDTPTVQRTVFRDIASLGLDADPVFLAAHTSIEIDHLKGPATTGADREVAVLRALDSSFGDQDENTLIAVTGPAGSGKSHLVRWVRAQLSENQETYYLIHVPRELATLRQLLGHVLDGMPGPESDAVRAELDKAIARKRPEQLAEELLDKLRSVLSYELPDAREGHDVATRAFFLGERRPSETTRRKGGLADLLLAKPIRDHMLRPDGAIARIVDSLRGLRHGGDEETPEFDPTDWPTRQAGIVAALGDRRMERLWTLLKRDPAPAVALLNEGRRLAIADTLGMKPGVNLGEVFAHTRRRLRKENKDLVLLFEDLAQFGLFDGELFDQFVLQPGADYAPLRALFAITDGKFDEDVRDTVKDRLAHHFRIGELRVRSDSGDPTEQGLQFVARYLNVARVGRDRLIESWEKADASQREDGTWIPNACLDRGDGRECQYRHECWPAFKDVDEKGLYPYDPTALRRALKKRGDTVSSRTLVTEIIRDFLIEADAEIMNGVFPSEGVRHRFDFNIGLPKDSVVPPGVLDEAQRERLLRTRVIWADGAVEHQGITKAFDLPVTEGLEPGPEVEPRKETVTSVRPEPLGPLFAWENGDRLPEREAVWYREHLYALAEARVDLSSLLVDPGDGPGRLLFTRVLTPNSFELDNAPGQPAGRNRLRFPVSANGPGVMLLAAVRWFWDHGHWQTTREDRKWDFPLDPAIAQLALDEFLDEAAGAAEDSVASSLQHGPLDPASAAVALRAAASRALGRVYASDSSGALAWALEDAPLDQPSSPEWAEVRAAALATLQGIDPSWVASFAAARQGDTGEPLVVDAARLMPVARTAVAAPSDVMSGNGTFDEAFSQLTQHWRELHEAMEAAAAPEASSLAQVLSRMRDILDSGTVQDAISESESAGRLAADNTVFRPHHLYAAFREASDRLRDVSSVDTSEWLSALPGLDSRAPSTDAVLDAQRWASVARSVSEDLALLLECLNATKEEIAQRLVQDAGADPKILVSKITSKAESLADTLKAIEGDQ